MTGPEHYAEAEKYLDQAIHQPGNHERLLHHAEVHAMLAVAAATALNDNNPNGEGMRNLDWTAWIEAAGTKRPYES